MHLNYIWILLFPHCMTVLNTCAEKIPAYICDWSEDLVNWMFYWNELNFAQSISVCVHVYECNSSRIFCLTIVYGYRFYELLIDICSKLKSSNRKKKFEQINWPSSSICHYGHSFISFSSTLREKKTQQHAQHVQVHNTQHLCWK